mmetsp:Transcript_775/g.2806  ORF Transcript_775/g.2806 Transcript_775/m.2806 type:complete len:469 (-) Transcript_775:39-1445(-)
MFPIVSASFKCIASTPFSASSLQPSHSQRLLSTRHSPPVERRRQHIAVVNGASDVNNVTDGGTSDSHRSFIERDANKSARVLQNQKPLRFGFIGCGAMAEAMARGFLDSKVVQSESIACYGGKNQTSNGRASLFKEELGIENIVSNASAVLDESDIIFLCVKPNKMLSILDEIKPRVKPWHVFVSVAAGIKTSDIEKHLNIGTNAKSSERGRQADGSNGNLKSRGLFNLGGRKKDSDSTSMKSYDYDDGDDDDDDDDRHGKEEGGSGAEDDDATLTPFTVASVERETAKALENLKLELGKLRTSRASTGVVENIMIANIYESSAPPVPLKSLGAITVRDAKTISIALYDNSEPNKNAVENAIVNEKHLKFGAKKDESGVLVSLPEMDANARKEVVKMAQELGEKSKIGVRRARKKAIDAVKKQTYTLKLFGEDKKKRFEKSIQKVHDDAIKEIDRLEKMKKEHIESGL